jgi:hypothetical protein
MNSKKYHIILFNNKRKKKLLFSSNLRKTVNQKYKELKKKTNPIFPLKILNREECFFEIALVERKSGKETGKLKKDDVGRWTRNVIKNQDYQLIEVAEHQVEGTLYDHQHKNRITTQELLSTYLPKSEMCQLFSLNNKIVMQKEDEFSLFSLKTVSESKRFMKSISSYFTREGITHCLLVSDFSTVQRKQLYKILENKGFKKSLLYKHYTQ